jgi:hypothetical protein
MSRSRLRQVRRLKARAEPLIAERDRRWKKLEKLLPSLAEAHLLRVILVFRLGEPRIDEPLALAYRRALAKLNDPSTIVAPLSVSDDEGKPSHPMDSLALAHFRGILEREPPDRDIKQKISAWVNQMPDWLRHLCDTTFSTGLLKLESPPLSQDMRKFRRTESDQRAWPMLPQGMLQPPSAIDEQIRSFEHISAKEALSLLKIYEKPQWDWTRRERRFLDEIFARNVSARFDL